MLATACRLKIRAHAGLQLRRGAPRAASHIHSLDPACLQSGLTCGSGTNRPCIESRARDPTFTTMRQPTCRQISISRQHGSRMRLLCFSRIQSSQSRADGSHDWSTISRCNLVKLDFRLLVINMHILVIHHLHISVGASIHDSNLSKIFNLWTRSTGCNGTSYLWFGYFRTFGGSISESWTRIAH